MLSLTGIISNLQKYSLHDGPGIRTTVFFKGCPLRCWWCHNPESQEAGKELMLWPSRCIACGACVEVCKQGAISWREEALTPSPSPKDGRGEEDLTPNPSPNNGRGGKDLTLGSSLTLGERREVVTERERCIACGDCVEVCYAQARELVGREMSVAEVMEEIEKDRPFYEESGGGATFSGGEPLFQPDFLLALLQACQEKGIHTALDTCGYAPWEVFDRIRAYVDVFLYDLKLLDETRHRELTGVSNQLILSNLRMLSERGHQIILRAPIIPGVNDDEEQIGEIGAFAAALPHLVRVDLLPYHHIALEKYQRLGKVYSLPEARPPSPQRMTEIAQILRSFDLLVKIGG